MKNFDFGKEIERRLVMLGDTWIEVDGEEIQLKDAPRPEFLSDMEFCIGEAVEAHRDMVKLGPIPEAKDLDIWFHKMGEIQQRKARMVGRMEVYLQMLGIELNDSPAANIIYGME
jgi:hypothetical protein